jgi:hypothetical protein
MNKFQLQFIWIELTHKDKRSLLQQNSNKWMQRKTINNLLIQLKELKPFLNEKVTIVIDLGRFILSNYSDLEHLVKSLNKMVYKIVINVHEQYFKEEIMVIIKNYDCFLSMNLGKPDLLDTTLFEQNIKLYSLSKIINLDLDPVKTYLSLVKYNPSVIDFPLIYKNDAVMSINNSKTQGPHKYGNWLTSLTKYYLDADYPIPIRIIDLLITRYIKSKLRKKPLEDNGELIIKSDGTFTNNCSKTNIHKDSTKNNWNININSLIYFLMTKTYYDQTLDPKLITDTCFNCKYLICCKGININSNWTMFSAINQPSVFCSDFLHFFTVIGEILDKHLLKKSFIK